MTIHTLSNWDSCINPIYFVCKLLFKYLIEYFVYKLFYVLNLCFICIIFLRWTIPIHCLVHTITMSTSAGLTTTMTFLTTFHTVYLFITILVHHRRHSNNLYNGNYLLYTCHYPLYNDIHGYTYYTLTYSIVLRSLLLDVWKEQHRRLLYPRQPNQNCLIVLVLLFFWIVRVLPYSYL